MLNSHLFYAGFILTDPSDNYDIYKIISKNHQPKLFFKKVSFTTIFERKLIDLNVKDLDGWTPIMNIALMDKIMLSNRLRKVVKWDFICVIFKKCEIQGWMKRWKKLLCMRYFLCPLYSFCGWKSDGKIWRDEYDKKSVIIVIKSPSLCFSFFPGFWHTLIMWPKTRECPGWCSTIPETLKV